MRSTSRKYFFILGLFFVLACGKSGPKISLKDDHELIVHPSSGTIFFKVIEGQRSAVALWNGKQLSVGPWYDDVASLKLSLDGKFFDYFVYKDLEHKPREPLSGIHHDPQLLLSSLQTAKPSKTCAGDSTVWSQDRRHWACVEAVDETPEKIGDNPVLERVLVDGRPQKKYSWIGYLQFIPQTSRVIYVGRHEGDKKASLVINSEEKATYDFIQDLKISRDGKVFYVIAQQGNNVFVTDLEKQSPSYKGIGSLTLQDHTPLYRTLRFENNESEIVQGDKTLVHTEDWLGDILLSSDEKHFAFQENSHEGSQIILDGQSLGYYRVGDDGLLPTILGFSFSADSEHFVYFINEALKKERVVLDKKEEEVFDEIKAFSWSPTGHRYAYIGRQGQNEFLILDGKKLGPYREIKQITFSKDSSSWMAAVRRDNVFSILMNGDEKSSFYDDVHHLRFLDDQGKTSLVVAQLKDKMALFIDQQEIARFEGIGDFGAPSRYRKDAQRWELKKGELKGFGLGQGDYSEKLILELNHRIIDVNDDSTGGLELHGPYSYKNADVFLLGIYSGDGCMAQYRIFEIQNEVESWTDVFGNCESPKIQWSHNRLTLTFPPREYLGNDSPQEVWVYENNKLEHVK